MTTMEFHANVSLRYSDEDKNGHVNHAKVVTAIEEARILWLNKIAGKQGLTSFTGPKVVASLHVDYHAPVYASEDLVICISTVRIGRTSFSLDYRGIQREKQCFVANTVMVVMDESAQKPRSLSDAEREYLSRYTGRDAVQDETLYV